MPNPDLQLQYPRTNVDNAPLDANTNLYTQKRVNNFVSEYADYKKKVYSQSPDDAGNPNIYSYYHFVESPLGVTSTNLGSISTKLCLDTDKTTLLLNPYSPIAGNVNGQYNTPDGHKLNLMKDYSKFLDSIDAQTDNIQVLDVDQITSITIKDLGTKAIYATNDLEDYVDGFKTNGGNSASAGNITSYGIEIFAYIQFPSIDEYLVSFEVYNEAGSVSNFLIWIGDVALCEYTAANASVYLKTNSIKFTTTDARKIPIRIQYYGKPSSTTATRKTPQEVLGRLRVKNNNNNTIINLTNSLFTKKNKDTDPFIYPPLYAAFCSQLQNGYLAGKFLCYSNFGAMMSGDKETLYKFYNVINKNKRDIASGKYDLDSANNPEVGELPSLQQRIILKFFPVRVPMNKVIYRMYFPFIDFR